MKKIVASLTIVSILVIQSGCSFNQKPKDQAKSNSKITTKIIKKSKTKAKKQAIQYTMPKNYTVPVITPKTKVAYLTFDDGPSKNITPKMLDVLAKYNVKATFFLVGSYVKRYPDVVKRIYDEGHSIGNHSFTHNYKKVYASWNALYNEVMETNSLIYKYTHAKCYLFRAPGGSQPFMKNSYITNMESIGMKIFDWNCTNGDGLNKNLSPATMLYNVEKTATENHLFILMHTRDDNKNSLAVLPSVIEYLKKKGYIFRPIIKETKELRFKQLH